MVVTHLSVVGICLVTSLSVNVVVFLYFAIYLCMEKCLSRWCRRQSMELVDFHRTNARVLRITYLDVVVGLILPILALVVTFKTGVLTDRMQTGMVYIQFAFSVALGVFICMLFINMFVNSVSRSIDVVYNIVAISVFSIALGIQEEPFIGLIVMSAQGSRSTRQVQCLMKSYWKSQTPRCRQYSIVVVTNTIFTVLFNGIIPILYLLSTIMQTYSMNSQLSDYSIGFFYAYLVFFSFMNGWALCAVTDECKQYRRKATPPSYQRTIRSPGLPLRITSNFQPHEGRNLQFPALPNEILPPPSYSQVLKELSPIIDTSVKNCCEKNPEEGENDFVSIPLQTQ